VFKTDFLAGPVQRFQRLAFLVFHTHIDFHLTLFVGLFAAGPFIGFAYRALEIVTCIHFKRQILISHGYILGRFGKHTVEFLPAEIRNFDATIVRDRGLIEEFTGIEGVIVGGEGTASHTGTDALRVMGHEIHESIGRIRLTRQLQHGKCGSAAFGIGGLAVIGGHGRHTP